MSYCLKCKRDTADVSGKAYDVGFSSYEFLVTVTPSDPVLPDQCSYEATIMPAPRPSQNANRLSAYVHTYNDGHMEMTITAIPV